MTKIEKQMIAVVVVMIIFLVFSIHSCNTAIEEAGGMRNIIVEAGKDMKEIKKEINNEN